MNCKACESPLSGLIRAGCRDCTLRELARGPLFFQSMREQRLTESYRAALRMLGDVEAVHAEVKAVAKTLYTGAVRA